MSTATDKLHLVKPELTDTADITAFNQNWDTIDEKLGNVDGCNIVNATSEDGVTYVATNENITLRNGTTITLIPDKTSASTAVMLDLNGSGAMRIYQSTAYASTTNIVPSNATWLSANKPIQLVFNGTHWKTVGTRTAASDFYGTLKVENGGTGVTSMSELRSVIGVTLTAAGTYEGNGTYGASNPNTLTFDFVPKIVFLAGCTPYLWGDRGFSTIEGGTLLTYANTVTVTTNENGGGTMTWYCNVADGGASAQQNSGGTTYRYVAIG